MISVALTGRIGSGKSCAANAFQKLGVPVLDLDAVGRTLQQQPDVAAQLIKTLGHQVAHNGVISRCQLASICFASNEKMQQLEAIMHPLIWQQAKQWCQQQQAPYGIIEASSLRHHHPDIDYIVAVTAPEAIRRQRVVARGKQTENDFVRINRLQQPPPSDFTIENHSDLAHLSHQVRALHSTLLARINQT